MRAHLRALYDYRDLLWLWTLRDLKVRYKQSLLGAGWAILQPLSLMLMFTFIFAYVLKVETGDTPYPLFAYSGLLPWTFLATSVSFAVPSLTSNLNLVTRTYFPREILPIAAVGAALVDYLVASVVFVGMLVFYQVPISAPMVLMPALLVIQLLLTLGIVWLASAVNVFYRDVRFVVPLILQLWMYASPVIYPISLLPESIRSLYMLNPMAGLIEAYRDVMLRGQWPNWGYLGSATAVSVTLAILGYMYFKRVEWQFADLI